MKHFIKDKLGVGYLSIAGVNLKRTSHRRVTDPHCRVLTCLRRTADVSSTHYLHVTDALSTCHRRTVNVPPKLLTRYKKAVSADSRPTVGRRIVCSHKPFNKLCPRYLKIQLEDLKDYQRALSYIGKLGFYEVQLRCKKYFSRLSIQVYLGEGNKTETN